MEGVFMRYSMALTMLFTAACIAWDGPPPEEIEGALRTGLYEVSNLLVRNAPSSKQNGSAWDPMGGAPDILLEIFTDNGSGAVFETYTSTRENSGTSAVWSDTYLIQICGPEDFSGAETQNLLFKVWDSDTMSPDFMDSGTIGADEISTEGTNTVVCNYGTTITFDIVWVGMQ